MTQEGDLTMAQEDDLTMTQEGDLTMTQEDVTLTGRGCHHDNKKCEYDTGRGGNKPQGWSLPVATISSQV